MTLWLCSTFNYGRQHEHMVYGQLLWETTDRDINVERLIVYNIGLKLALIRFCIEMWREQWEYGSYGSEKRYAHVLFYYQFFWWSYSDGQRAGENMALRAYSEKKRLSVCSVLFMIISLLVVAGSVSSLHLSGICCLPVCEISPLCLSSKHISRLSSSHRPFCKPRQAIPVPTDYMLMLIFFI